METYKPNIIREKSGHIYVEMLVEAKECHLCKKVMIKEGCPLTCGGSFPNYQNLDIKKQAENVGMTFISDLEVDDKPICIECKEAGKADFLCAICKERKLTDRVHKSFGLYNIDFLCEDCYETVPAKTWEEKEDQLYSAHRYD